MRFPWRRLFRPIQTTAPVASSLTNGALSAPKPPPGGTLPLVFQQVDEKSLHLTPEQTQILNKLRYDFTQAVQSGGSTANAAGVLLNPGDIGHRCRLRFHSFKSNHFTIE